MGDLEPIPAELTDGPEWASEELDEALLAGAALPDEAEKWVILDDGQAEWAMRKVAALMARGGEVKARAGDWRARIDEWERAEMARVQRPAGFFLEHLERYGLAVRAVNPRQATIPLPSGDIATRAPKGPTVAVSDEEALLAWLGEQLPTDLYAEVVKVTVAAQILPLRKLVTAVEVKIPWCATCGAQLAESVTDAGPSWSHAIPDDPEFDVDNEFDHDATPAPGYSVRWAGPERAEGEEPAELVGVEVPGLSAALGRTTVNVRPR